MINLGSHPVSVHIGEVNAKRKAQPPIIHHARWHNLIVIDDILLAQPVLFSKRVKASLVDTLLSPEQTSKAIMAAMVVPT